MLTQHGSGGRGCGQRRILGSIPDLKRVHGIALVPDLGRGFISDGGADEAVVFDLKTLKVTGHIKTGGNPDWHPLRAGLPTHLHDEW